MAGRFSTGLLILFYFSKALKTANRPSIFKLIACSSIFQLIQHKLPDTENAYLIADWQQQ
jgi:hypothetical protein